MKHITKNILAILLIFSFAFVGCKKGENDPFLSLKSRKGRVTGTWKMVKGEFVVNDNGDEFTVTSDGSKFSFSDNSPSYGSVIELTFNKDYTFQEKETYDDGDGSDYKGNWAFVKKSKDAELKNKEAIVISHSERSLINGSSTSTTKIDGFDFSNGTYIIDQLKNKEMIIKIDQQETDSDGYSYSVIGSYTFEKQ